MIGPQTPSRTLLQRWRELQQDGGGRRPIRVAITATYTIEPLLPFLGCFLAERGLLATFVVAPFNQLYQSLLDPETTFGDQPLDALIVLPRLEELCAPQLGALATLGPEAIARAHTESAAEIDRLLGALAAFARRRPAAIVCGNFEPADAASLGVLDASHAASESELRALLGVQLQQGLRRQHVLCFDVAGRAAELGTQQALDARMFLLSRQPYSVAFGRALMFGLSRLVAPLFVAPKAVIVLDLDNTLWGGVIGEDGLDGIALGNSGLGAAFVSFQRTLLQYRQQGVLLCVASKNNEADAWQVFDEHPAMAIRREHLAATRINWNPKSESLRELAGELSLGVDSLVFVDDNPLECEAIRRFLPEVTVLQLPTDPVAYSAALRALPELDRAVLTDEDRSRAEQYRVDHQRQAAATALAGDATQLAAYLQSLELEVFCRTPEVADVPRVAQLTQKTNQFNLTTIRRTEPEIRALLDDPRQLVLALDVRDRFGTYGLVGVLIATAQTETCWLLDTLLLSCRVLGRAVETALLGETLAKLAARGAGELRGRYLETAKNAPAKDFLPRHGFVAVAGGDWRLSPLPDPTTLAPHIARSTRGWRDA